MVNSPMVIWLRRVVSFRAEADGSWTLKRLEGIRQPTCNFSKNEAWKSMEDNICCLLLDWAGPHILWMKRTEIFSLRALVRPFSCKWESSNVILWQVSAEQDHRVILVSWENAGMFSRDKLREISFLPNYSCWKKRQLSVEITAHAHLFTIGNRTY